MSNKLPPVGVGTTHAGNNLRFMALTADAYANVYSGCTKVAVGSVIFSGSKIVSLGANRTVPGLCKTRGCLRVEKYGNNDKTHRNPEDCRAVHSEVDALIKANLMPGMVYDMLVTRYPCEACARAIALTHQIRTVYYTRNQHPSEETVRIFKSCGVNVVHLEGFEYPDATN